MCATSCIGTRPAPPTLPGQRHHGHLQQRGAISCAQDRRQWRWPDQRLARRRTAWSGAARPGATAAPVLFVSPRPPPPPPSQATPRGGGAAAGGQGALDRRCRRSRAARTETADGSGDLRAAEWPRRSADGATAPRPQEEERGSIFLAREPVPDGVLLVTRWVVTPKLHEKYMEAT